MATTAERLNEAVQRHKIYWTDIVDRVVENGEVSRDAAAEQVLRLYEKKGVSLPVAVALIDLIVEKTR